MAEGSSVMSELVKTRAKFEDGKGGTSNEVSKSFCTSGEISSLPKRTQMFEIEGFEDFSSWVVICVIVSII
jgi:hypothetical protein